MSSEIEVIPTVPLDWSTLRKVVAEKIAISETLDGFAYQITYRNKSFRVLNIESKDDFEVHSPVEYLDERRSDLVDIEWLARGWKKVGHSYHISPEGSYEDPDFIDLVVVIAEITKGIILNIQGIWSWSIGLATPQEIMARSEVLR